MPQISPDMQQDVVLTRVTPRPYSRLMVWLVLASAALIFALWLLGTPGGVLGKADAVGYAICHRIEERSFIVNDRPLPLCARCTGIYLGVMTGFAILAASARRRAGLMPPVRVLVILALFVVAMGLDGVNSYLHLFPGYEGPYEPTNWLRLISGSLTGLTMINIIYPVFNTTIWARPVRQRTLQSLRTLSGMILVVGLVDTLVLLEHPVVLLVFGLVSAAGPVLILTMVWTILFVTVSRRENTAMHWRDLVIPVLAGLAITFLMLGAIDAARFMWTGTWAGFDFSTAAILQS